MNFIEKNLALIFLGIAILISAFDFYNLSTMDYLFAFLVGYLLSKAISQQSENNANRVMLLTLHNALLGSKALKKADIFLAQNSLTGKTDNLDYKKMTRRLRSESIYLHDYIDHASEDEIISQIDNHRITIFDSFNGLTDRFKNDNYYKIQESENENY